MRTRATGPQVLILKGFIWGLYWDNGKKNGNHYNGLYSCRVWDLLGLKGLGLNGFQNLEILFMGM